MANGFGAAMGYDPTMSVEELSEWAYRAEGANMSMAFFSETIFSNRDSASALAAFALRTSRIPIGCTQVVRLRSPLVMAQTAATLDELSHGRLTLVLGSCTVRHALRNGLPAADPLQTLEEYVDIIRLLLTGERVTYKGESIQITDVGLNWTPVRSRIPIWIAAATRRGLETAGRIGDGVLLDACCSPEYDAKAIEIIRQSAMQHGRDLSNFAFAQLINTSIAVDLPTALDDVRWEVASKFSSPETSRARIRVGDPYLASADLELFEKTYTAGGLAALTPIVPDKYVDVLTASGPPDRVRERLGAYRAAGVDFPILRPATQAQFGDLLKVFGSGSGQGPAQSYPGPGK